LQKSNYHHALCAVLGADFSKTRCRGRRLEQGKFDENSPKKVYLAFSNMRKFGRVWFTPNPEDVLGKLGPEPLSDDFTAEMLYDRLQKHKPLYSARQLGKARRPHRRLSRLRGISGMEEAPASFLRSFPHCGALRVCLLAGEKPFKNNDLLLSASSCTTV